MKFTLLAREPRPREDHAASALREGFRFIGIEREQEYFDIAQQRIEHAAKSDS